MHVAVTLQPTVACRGIRRCDFDDKVRNTFYRSIGDDPPASPAYEDHVRLQEITYPKQHVNRTEQKPPWLVFFFPSIQR